MAIALLGIAGLGTVSALRQATLAESAARAEERRLDSADRLLAALTLLHAAELDQRLGRHPVGEFVVLVSRPEATLYRIAVAGREAPEVELLTTLVYRAARRVAP